ncbi:MAG: hypothetical protein KKF39_01190 [Nanoarchaeota archaeon]|nr:hypothetical protein [Nanoarchaeota archaeon]
MNLLTKSLRILKSLQLKNGGILATPADGAYPYIYPRDSVIVTKAFNVSGLTKRSEKFYRFLNKNAKIEQYKEIFHRYTPNGLPAVTRKHQHDNTGLVLHGIYNTFLYNKNKEFLADTWALVKGCVASIEKNIKRGLIYTETSIHEFEKLEKSHEIWANCACCRGLYDAAEIAKVLNCKTEQKRWFSEAKQLHKNIKSKLFNKRSSLYMKNTKYKTATDISQLAPFYFNLDTNKTILKKTLAHIMKNLWYGETGGIRRFKKFEIARDWHWYSGGSGAWVAFTAWLAHFYKKINDKKNAKLCESWIEKTATRTSGLLPEHVTIKEEFYEWEEHEIEFNKRILNGMRRAEKLNKTFKKKYNEDLIYWATPLGWAHAEYVLLKKKK